MTRLDKQGSVGQFHGVLKYKISTYLWDALVNLALGHVDISVFFILHQTRFVIPHVPLQKFAVDGDEGTLIALHLHVLLWMLSPDVRLQGLRLDGAVVTMCALVGFGIGMPQPMLPQHTRIPGHEVAIGMFTAEGLLTRMLSQVDEPCGLPGGLFTANVAPIRHDLIVTSGNMLRQCLGVGKDIEADVTGLLGVPAIGSCCLLIQMIDRMVAQFGVLREGFWTHRTGKPTGWSMTLQMPENLDSCEDFVVAQWTL